MSVLLVDDRENSVSPFLAGKGVPFLIKRITTGDFCIIRTNPANPADDKILAVFERKSLADFAASIKDGRYENYTKMVEIQKEYEGCQLYYIIESQKAYPAPDDRFDRLPYSNIAAAINKLEIVYHIQVLKTRDPEDTASKLGEKVRGYDHYWAEIAGRYKQVVATKPAWPRELVKVLMIPLADPTITVEFIKMHFQSDYNIANTAIKQHIPGADLNSYIDILKNKERDDQTRSYAAQIISAILKANAEWDAYKPNKLMENMTESHYKSIDEIKLKIWMSISGVSWAIAPLLKAKFTLGQFVNKQITTTSLADINYVSGKKLHTSLVTTLTSGPDEKTELKMLQEIPNLGQKAEQLLKHGRLADLIKIDEKTLAAMKTGRQNLGPAKAAEIIAAFA